MNVSIPSKVFNMTLVSNVKKQLERVDSTSQIIGTRDDSRDTETIVEDCCFKKLIGWKSSVLSVLKFSIRQDSQLSIWPYGKHIQGFLERLYIIFL